MNNNVIIKGAVLSPGITDRHGDRPLTAEEIQKAAYQYLPGYAIVDVQHSIKKQAEVVESYVAPEDTNFNGVLYPAGTWFVTAKVVDPTISNAILNGELTGFSVGAFPEKDYSQLKRNIPPGIAKGMFSDVKPGDWFPLTISIVDIPAYPEMIFKVFNESDFIKKQHDMEENNMSEDKTRDTLLEKVFDYFIKKESPEDEVEETVVAYVTQDAFDAKMDELKELITKSTQVEDVSEDEDESEESDEEAEESEDEKSDEGVEDEVEEDEDDEEEADKDELITKSLKMEETQAVNVEPLNKRIGRDIYGRKVED